MHTLFCAVATKVCYAPVGTKYFPERHTAENILRRLQDLRMDFGLLPILPPHHPLTETEIRADPARAFSLEAPEDRLAITTDRGSDIRKATDGGGTFDWMPCICHILNTAVDHALLTSGILTFLTPLRALAKQVHKSPLLWGKFCEIQREHLAASRPNSVDEDESDEDYSGCDSSDESAGGLSDGSDAGGSDDETKPQEEREPLQPTRVLRLGSWCKTRWNSTFFLIKRAVLLEESVRKLLVQKEVEVNTSIDANAWACFRSLVPVMESIKELSERCEGDTYITISDVLYNVLKLLYDRMSLHKEGLKGQPYASEFVMNFREKLIEIVDDENLLYAWSMAALVDGRRSSLHFLRRIWNSDNEFPKVRAVYNTLFSWKVMMRDCLCKLVSCGFMAAMGTAV